MVNPQITSLLCSGSKTGVLLPHINIQSEIRNHQADWVAGFGGGKQKHIIWGSHAHSGEPTSHDQETQHELEQGSAPFFGKRLDSKYFRL